MKTALCLLLLRHLNEAKYIPELAYYGLRLLCSPLHGAEDKVKVGPDLTVTFVHPSPYVPWLVQ